MLNVSQPVNRSAKFFGHTSDAFFEEYDLGDILNGWSVDLAFIDGMHLFEFALRDFMNLERFCGKGSTIMVHDCYPVSEDTARREESSGFWSGDVWKLIVCLKKYRPELNISVVDVAPAGLGLITGLDPSSAILSERYDEICSEFVPLGYEALAESKERQLNRIPNDWPLVRDLLTAELYGASPPASGADGEQHPDGSVPHGLIEVLEIPYADGRGDSLWGGLVERPEPEDWTESRSILVAGWVLSKQAPAVAVELIYQGDVIRVAPIDRKRPDVASRYPDVPGSDRCGFVTVAGVPRVTPEFAIDIRAVVGTKKRLPLASVKLRHASS